MTPLYSKVAVGIVLLVAVLLGVAGMTRDTGPSTGSGDTVVATGLSTTDIDTSAELAAILGDETGTAGSAVFSASPTFTGTLAAADLTASGNLTVTGNITTTNGTSTASTTIVGYGQPFIVEGGTTYYAKAALRSDDTNVGAAWIYERNASSCPLGGCGIWAYRSRGDRTTKSAANAADDIFTLYTGAYDGTDYEPAASINFQTGTTTPSSNIMSGIIRFLTNPGGQTLTERMKIDANGKVGIASSTPQRTLSVTGSAVSEECALTDGATITFNLRNCNQGRVTLGGNRTIDFTNEGEALGQPIRLIACQDGTGSRTLTWDAAVRWAGGSAPTLTTTANHCDVIAGFTTNATGTPVILLDKALNF